jgi:hypothetical protein
MPENKGGKGLSDLILLVALAVCYEQGEEFITEEQVISRGFAPTEAFTKRCISRLIDAGAIEFKVIEPIFPDERTESILWIKLPSESRQDIDAFIFKMSLQIKTLLASSLDCQLEFKNLSEELICFDCIEYCEYCAKRADFIIVNINHNSARLKLLIMECSINQIYMILWRAMKMASQKNLIENGEAEFSIIINFAFDLFLNFRKMNIDIEAYNRPSLIKTSVLSGMIELFRAGINEVS